MPAWRGGSRALVPFYDYDEDRFFRSDGAPADVAARRRAGSIGWRAALRERFAAHRSR